MKTLQAGQGLTAAVENCKVWRRLARALYYCSSRRVYKVSKNPLVIIRKTLVRGICFSINFRTRNLMHTNQKKYRRLSQILRSEASGRPPLPLDMRLRGLPSRSGLCGEVGYIPVIPSIGRGVGPIADLDKKHPLPRRIKHQGPARSLLLYRLIYRRSSVDVFLVYHPFQLATFSWNLKNKGWLFLQCKCSFNRSYN
jgi:hypothetical protein